MVKALLFSLFCFLCHFSSFSQKQKKPIYLTGIVCSDSFKPIPFAHFMNFNRSRAATAGPDGFFVLYCRPGDTLHISAVGFQPESYIVPDTITYDKLTLQPILKWVGAKGIGRY